MNHNRILYKERIIAIMLAIAFTLSVQAQKRDVRRFWIESMIKITEPVLTHLSQGTLRQNMPFESKSDNPSFCHLEAVGRTICGIAPWLELGPDNTPEGRLRKKYIDLTVKGLDNAVNPTSKDYLVFGRKGQPLVDAAFLAQGLLRAPEQIWGNLSPETRRRMIREFKSTRIMKPYENNWVLFSSMIEAALLEFTGECDMEKLLYGIRRFRDDWYKGDALYGDGKEFHMDYYNSYVIHPMLTDILRIMKKHNIEGSDFLDLQLERHSRYAEILERFISPEGSFPVVGRSICYRFGAFHALSQAVLDHILPQDISPAQVRCALTAVISRQMHSKDNFDKKGWLKVGFNGAQLGISESYINTGSTYLCSTIFLPLGLDVQDEFWSAPAEKWTNAKAWDGDNTPIDRALRK